MRYFRNIVEGCKLNRFFDFHVLSWGVVYNWKNWDLFNYLLVLNNFHLFNDLGFGNLFHFNRFFNHHLFLLRWQDRSNCFCELCTLRIDLIDIKQSGLLLLRWLLSESVLSVSH